MANGTSQFPQPGLTGYWQVNGKNRTRFIEMIKLDIFYTKKMSLWLDLTIMLKTLPALITQVIDSRSASRTVAVNLSNKFIAEQC